MIIWILLFLLASPAQAVEKEIDFSLKSDKSIYEVGRDGSYDYSPSIIEQENGDKYIYVCGGFVSEDDNRGHDAIFLTVINKDGQKTIDSKRVLTPLVSNPKSDDAEHACAPSVIKHSFSLLEGGKEKYLMYYECAPKVHNQTTGQWLNNFAQVCLAFSDDGIEWKKYNEEIFNSEHRFANSNEPPTAVVKTSEEMNSKFGIQKLEGKYVTSAREYDINSYGVGHPSATTYGGKIWLHYYDSKGEWNNRGIYRKVTSDGFHFYPETTQIKQLKSPYEIKYVETPMNGHDGFFLGLMVAKDVYYNYSWDGINWFWTEEGADEKFYDNYLGNNFLIGKVTEGKCMAPGGAGLVTNKLGVIKGTNVEFMMNEGYLGSADNCNATNGCKCYSKDEDTARGYTWQSYGFNGVLTNSNGRKPGDANGDGLVNIVDYNIWKREFINNTKDKADFNGNGEVDLNDYKIWKQNV